MKSLYITALLLSLTSGLFAGQPARKNKEEEKPGLELSIRLRDDGERIDNYKLIIYCDDGSAPDTIHVELRRTIFVKLQYNHNYTIRHIKEGYRERVLLVDTHVDKKTSQRWLVFDYQIELIREEEPANTLADLPVAVVHYHKSRKSFEYNRSYHHQVRTPSAPTTITQR